jgi:hypothetical protein
MFKFFINIWFCNNVLICNHEFIFELQEIFVILRKTLSFKVVDLIHNNIFFRITWHRIKKSN